MKSLRKNTNALLILKVVGGIGAALVLLGVTVIAVLENQTLSQHANFPTYTSIAVQGSIYVDTNANGQKDPGEQNYTGTPIPTVQVALFSDVCVPTMPPNTPTPPSSTSAAGSNSGCYYETRCPGIMCRAKGGGIADCACKTILICPPSVTPSSNSGSTSTYYPTPVTGRSIGSGSNWGKNFNITPPQGPDNPRQGKSRNQAQDRCNRTPTQVINCPVSLDGTFTCLANNIFYVEASLGIISPRGSRYVITSPNPVDIQSVTSHVDFGIISL